MCTSSPTWEGLSEPRALPTCEGLSEPRALPTWEGLSEPRALPTWEGLSEPRNRGIAATERASHSQESPRRSAPPTVKNRRDGARLPQSGIAATERAYHIQESPRRSAPTTFKNRRDGARLPHSAPSPRMAISINAPPGGLCARGNALTSSPHSHPPGEPVSERFHRSLPSCERQACEGTSRGCLWTRRLVGSDAVPWPAGAGWPAGGRRSPPGAGFRRCGRLPSKRLTPKTLAPGGEPPWATDATERAFHIHRGWPMP